VSAVFSEDRVYRYTLTRSWEPEHQSRLEGLGLGGAERLSCLFVCLNPSTADEVTDDATVRRCIRFARAWGYSDLTVCNIFALRSRDPKALYAADDPVGPDNDQHLKREAARHELVVAAWGNHGSYRNRGRQVMEMLREGADVFTLGLNVTIEPKHPLYLPATTEPKVLWERTLRG
jgi:hypothetical protein